MSTPSLSNVVSLGLSMCLAQRWMTTHSLGEHVVGGWAFLFSDIKVVNLWQFSILTGDSQVSSGRDMSS